MKKLTLLFALFSILLLTLYCPQAKAAPGDLLNTYLPPPSAEFFGTTFTTSISGDSLFIGSPRDDAATTNGGAAYIYDSATGSPLVTLTSPVPTADENFGSIILPFDGKLLVTAPGNSATDGNVYVFNTSGTLLHTITNPTSSPGDNFGNTITIFNGNIAIGARDDDLGSSNAGVVHIFDGSTYSHITTISNPTPQPDDEFGYWLAVRNDHLLISSIKDDISATDAGDIYVYDTTHSLIDTISNPNPNADDFFGVIIDVSNDKVIIGAMNDDSGASNAGIAYIFTYNGSTYTLSQTLSNPTPVADDLFGFVVAAVGDNVLVTNVFDDTNGTNNGESYLFDGATGSLIRTYVNPTSSAHDNFGYFARPLGTDVLISARADDTIAGNSGAVYLFEGERQFTNIASSAGVEDTGLGGSGMAWGDYDNDGFLDFYRTNAVTGKLYRNNGNNTFTDQTVGAGVSTSKAVGGPSWGDFDNDGDLDLYLGRGENIYPHHLYQNNGNGTFSEIGASAGINSTQWSTTAAWADFDRDGDLDIYVESNGQTDKLYRNNGNSTFTDIAVSAGTNDSSDGIGAAWGDFDNDGDLDIYLATGLGHTSRLYRNNGNSTFTEIGVSAGVNHSGASRGVAWADYDNDGLLDLYVASEGQSNRLYKNAGNQTFTDESSSANVNYNGSSIGTAWADYDNDGDLDLYVAVESSPNRLYNNQNNGTFSEVSTAAGVDDSNASRTANWGDIDNDGDLDLYVVNGLDPSRLYKNQGNANTWLSATLEGTISNKNGIGARVVAVTGTTRQIREIDGGSGYVSQPSLPAEFGFESASSIDSLIVQWPSGLQQVQTNVGVNQAIIIQEPAGAAFTEIGGSAGVDDSSQGKSVAWIDYNNDGDLDISLTNRFSPVMLFRSNGDNTFTDVAVSAGININTNLHGGAWSDYDNDGDLDFYFTGTVGVPNHLFRNNGNGTFTDIAPAAGVTDVNNFGLMVTWADYNNDGYTDIYLAQIGTGPNRLYRNNGNQTFTEVGGSAGVGETGYSHASAWGDFDDDGDQDIYLANNSFANRLYRNNGDETFTDIAVTAGVADAGGGIGTSWIDYDNDSDLDLFVGNTTTPHRLYENNGNNTFTDVASIAGVDDNTKGQRPAWADYDNDGDVDLYTLGVPNNLYQNTGGVFVDVAPASQVADTGPGGSAAWGDMDNDGDLDLYVAVDNSGTNRLYENNGNANSWLSVDLEGTVSNRDGIGAKVIAVSGLLRQRRDVEGGTGWEAEHSIPAEFGFGTNGLIDSLIIHWPSGTIWDTTNVGVNQFLSITEQSQLTVSIPDTVSQYASTINVPVRISNTANHSIVAVELQIAFDKTIVSPGSPDKTEIAGTLVATGWSVEENILPGAGSIDTLSIAMSTAADTLSTAGDLIELVFQTANIRHPATTQLELTHVLLNEGTPGSTNQNGSLTLIGTDGTITAIPDTIRPADPITITVTDPDIDLDVGNPDQITATAISKGYGDTQSVTLIETGANTGIFAGSVNTAFALSAGPSEDGVVTTIAGDSICVSFTDSLTSVGTTLTRYDTIEVIGGEDGLLAVSYVVQALDGRHGKRDTVRIRVIDSDLDLDAGTADQVSLTITNTISGENESVILTETATNTGIFQARVPTIEGVSGTNNDGVLSLTDCDTLSITYIDDLTSQGGTLPINDITRVVNLFGDLRSNDQLQAFDAAGILAKAVGIGTYTAKDSLIADVDGNGACQAFDASQVLQYVVRLIDCFPVQTDTVFNPPQDVKNHPFLKPVPLNHIIALGNLQSQDDGTVLMPITLADRHKILSATLEIAHSDHIQILDVTTDADYDGFMVAYNTEKDRVRIAFAGAQSQVTGSGNLIYLHIKATDDLQLSLDHVALNGHTLTPAAPIEIITQLESATPMTYALHQNHPNPFNPETIIRYDLPEASDVHIVIYNVMGQEIQTLVSEAQPIGAHQIVWNAKDALGRNVSSGVYFVKMEANSFTQIRKMMLLR